MTLAQRYYLLFLFEIMMVARDRPIREANQDSEAARPKGEDRRRPIRINRTADTGIFSTDQAIQ